MRREVSDVDKVEGRVYWRSSNLVFWSELCDTPGVFVHVAACCSMY